jgi:hypothetical protein
VSTVEALTRDQLLDPEQCKDCHPKHYREWASSMHAYSTLDPVFVAMNQRGQRETNGALGDFCVKCHAPMAVREGATRDGLNLEQVPEHLKGVTCYFCHNAVGVGDHFNNDVHLANDTTMRGSISDPVPTKAHGATYSPLHDRNSGESSSLCGGCHDIVTPAGVHLERTFEEYQRSIFSKPGGFETCQGCHMTATRGVAADDANSNVPERNVHEHLWAGVDVALTDFPGREAQRAAVECALNISMRIRAILRDAFGGFTVQLETLAGHNQPSGSAQDRRMWLEFTAYDEHDNVLFENGRVADGEVEDQPGKAINLYRDWTYDADGNPAHMFWDAAPSTLYPAGFSSMTLPPASQLGAAHYLEARFQVPPAVNPAVTRVTASVRMRPMGIDILQDLVASGDLAESVIAKMPTFTLQGATVEWRVADGSMRVLQPEKLLCAEEHVCLLDPAASGCSSN